MSLVNVHTFEAIGTEWSVETAAPLSAGEIRFIHGMIADFDRTYSRFRDDSLVSHARDTAPGSFAFPASVRAIYDTYALLERVTDGAVNPLVGSVLEELGYDADYSLRPKASGTHRPLPFTDIVERKDTALVYHQSALLDVGAIGKGCLVDMVAAYVAENHDDFVVDAGGDMAVFTKSPYKIGLEHPQDFSQIIGTVSLQNQSICGSSPNRRSWGDGNHHIIDARTGRPANTNIIATWAIADTTLRADALTTALFFASPDRLLHVFGEFRYIIMTADGRVTHNMTDAQ